MVNCVPSNALEIRAFMEQHRRSSMDARSLTYPGAHLCFYVADKVLATLGEGTFGKVVKVKDLQM